jgi:transposase
LADPATRSQVFVEIARFHPQIVTGLTTNSATTVWQRLHDEQGLQASLRSFRRYLDRLVPEHQAQPQVTVRRDDPPPGEEAQIDYGYLSTWTDPSTSKRLRLWAFLMVLSQSRHTFLHVVSSLNQRSWLQAHIAAFSFFGGAPVRLVVDNLKTGVLRPDLYDPQLNRSYEQLARYYGTLVDPCRSGQPKDKPRVEKMIQYVRDSFFAGRTFSSLEEINLAAQKWCLSVAGERIHSTTGQRPLQAFLEGEASALRPLPSEPFALVTWTQAKVASDCHFQAAGGIYSVPHIYVGKKVDVCLSDSLVHIYYDHQLIKTHGRLHGKGRQTDWNDYPPDKAAFYQRNPNWCRTKAATLGEDVAQAVEILLSQHALHYLRQCQGIIGLADRYGHGRLNAACQRALAFGDPSYRTVRTILQKGLEGQLALPMAQTSVPTAGAYLHGPGALLSPHIYQSRQEEVHE